MQIPYFILVQRINKVVSQIYIQQVSVIKARIADELGKPTGKQKLQVGVSFCY